MRAEAIQFGIFLLCIMGTWIVLLLCLYIGGHEIIQVAWQNDGGTTEWRDVPVVEETYKEYLARTKKTRIKTHDQSRRSRKPLNFYENNLTCRDGVV